MNKSKEDEPMTTPQGHTLGPWEIDRECEDTIVDNTGRNIARVVVENHEANAHLIAAAPELLEAVKQLLYYAESGNHPNLRTFLFPGNTPSGFTAKLKSIVAKAEGRE